MRRPPDGLVRSLTVVRDSAIEHAALRSAQISVGERLDHSRLRVGE